MSLDTIISENKDYWSHRAPGYSEYNNTELNSVKREVWRNVLDERISAHFAGKEKSSLRVLEVGTGPGFFAIILTEADYRVTAIDLTPKMLDEARKNAASLAERIEFIEMNAEHLLFADESFDVIVTRNLTWNLPHPEKAYSEWHRVLRKGGLLLNFDANWYNYLFDEKAKVAYSADRKNAAEKGVDDLNIGDRFEVMEKIARRIPISAIEGPDWDRELLTAMGF